ncbi:unnamed protein product [Soboliphyme baturini]|uniref:F-BAR domain-containing protein n=1 Tax=Soboliphyme baturini TaxID=241478 RepID=A0A183I8Z5_9BILA|nr:unnamed protein product [Soboliphyme baturini]
MKFLLADMSFSPVWSLVKTYVESHADLHRNFVKSLVDLSKNVQKYTDEAIKIHKTVKERQSKTYDAVNLIQTTTTCLQKAKENYFLRCMELEKLKHENGTSKEVARSEMRVKKAREEYQQYVEKYASVRIEFMTRMSEAAKNFQEVEAVYLSQMKNYISEYAASFLGNQERITLVIGH